VRHSWPETGDFFHAERLTHVVDLFIASCGVRIGSRRRRESRVRCSRTCPRSVYCRSNWRDAFSSSAICIRKSERFIPHRKIDPIIDRLLRIRREASRSHCESYWLEFGQTPGRPTAVASRRFIGLIPALAWHSASSPHQTGRDLAPSTSFRCRPVQTLTRLWASLSMTGWPRAFADRCSVRRVFLRRVIVDGPPIRSNYLGSFIIWNRVSRGQNRLPSLIFMRGSDWPALSFGAIRFTVCGNKSLSRLLGRYRRSDAPRPRMTTFRLDSSSVGRASQVSVRLVLKPHPPPPSSAPILLCQPPLFASQSHLDNKYPRCI